MLCDCPLPLGPGGCVPSPTAAPNKTLTIASHSCSPQSGPWLWVALVLSAPPNPALGSLSYASNLWLPFSTLKTLITSLFPFVAHATPWPPLERLQVSVPPIIFDTLATLYMAFFTAALHTAPFTAHLQPNGGISLGHGPASCRWPLAMLFFSSVLLIKATPMATFFSPPQGSSRLCSMVLVGP
ncbi:hypothetical protein GOP47_0011847 [Adiantum capillus-veneris]|uniref:Uncharacterized protein n=1 Tax=Adiantum capillus-veneris TaxID=13818 RepID=A0A9D4UTI9_ADICA|nr:hypothetical protein GOP47_0011847 [Adiantum capillus-veneris]